MRLVATEMIVDGREAGGSAAGVGVHAEATQNNLPRFFVVGVLQYLLMQNLKVVGKTHAL